MSTSRNQNQESPGPVRSQKIGLLLSGGAARGAFQAGVVSAFARAEIQFEAIVGTSVGAVNGGALLVGRGSELVSLWRENLRQETWFDARLMLRGRSPFCISEAMRVMVDRYGDVPKILDHPTELLISTTQWATRRNVLFSTHDGRDWTEEERILQFLASLTIPWICTEKVVIRGERYCDGSLSENMPFTPLVDRGCDHIVVVDPSPLLRSWRHRVLLPLKSFFGSLPFSTTRVAAGLIHALTQAPPVFPDDLQVTWLTPPPKIGARALDFRSLDVIDEGLEAGILAGEQWVASLRGGERSMENQQEIRSGE
ncbi:MAG: patatin-like phospholipase family protein [Planctomycetota bacterium]|nr:patatin-like phospholipase family protein [Planctomycetota bacterium]